jgi:hypothetical protein
MRFLISTTQCTNSRVDTDGTDGCRQSLDIDGWIWVGMPFENGVADVTGCSHIGVVPFSVAHATHSVLLETNEIYREKLQSCVI